MSQTDLVYQEPGDGFEAKKLMHEDVDGRWILDWAKVRGAINQWLKSDALVVTENEEPTRREEFKSWDAWMGKKLGYSWMIVFRERHDRSECFEKFDDFMGGKGGLTEYGESRLVRVESEGHKELALMALKNEYEEEYDFIDWPHISVEEDLSKFEDESPGGIEVERGSRDRKLSQVIDLSPTEVKRLGEDCEHTHVLGFEVVGAYVNEGIPAILLAKDGEDYEVPLHFMADGDEVDGLS